LSEGLGRRDNGPTCRDRRLKTEEKIKGPNRKKGKKDGPSRLEKTISIGRLVQRYFKKSILPDFA